MAICADCQYPEEAWHFMEVCFGTPFYRRQDNKLYYSSAPYRRAHGIPANHNVLEGYLPYLMEIHVIKQEDMDFLYEQLENAEPMTQRELYYMSIIKKEAEKYFEGQNDLAETIQEIQTQITSWIKKNNAR